MKNFKYLSNPKEYNLFDIDADNTYIAHIIHMNSKEDLFENLSISLKFPSYFGYNWDAVSDFLRDLYWIEQKKIMLIHDCIDINVSFINIYVEILYDSIQSWKEGDEHELEVIFPKQREDIIEERVNKYRRFLG